MVKYAPTSLSGLEFVHVAVAAVVVVVVDFYLFLVADTSPTAVTGCSRTTQSWSTST